MRSTLLFLPLQPCHQQIHNSFLLIFRQFHSQRDTIPSVQAAPTAACTTVHCFENRMPMHRRLLPVIYRRSRCQLLPHKVPGMASHNVHPLLCKIFLLFFCQVKTRTEPGMLQFIQSLVNCLHYEPLCIPLFKTLCLRNCHLPFSFVHYYECQFLIYFLSVSGNPSSDIYLSTFM